MKLRLTAALLFVSHILLAQNLLESYHLLGIDDNVDYNIRIDEDLVKDIVSFHTEGNVLTIYGVRQIDTIITHLDKFLEVKFVVWRGTGVKNRVKVLLCVDNGKIFTSLLIDSDLESRVTEVYNKVADSLKLFDEEEQYHVLISIAEKAGGFVATLTESNYVLSKYDPSSNTSSKEVFRLNFDESGHYFFNSSKSLNNRYRVYSYKENSYSEKLISTEASAVELQYGIYFFIDGMWYREGRDNTLFYR